MAINAVLAQSRQPADGEQAFVAQVLARPVGLLSALLGVTALYLLAAIGGLNYAIVGSTVTLVWAPSGIALAAVLIGGYRMACGVALGALLANLWTGIPVAAAVTIAAGNTLEALVGFYLLRRVASFHNTLVLSADVFALIGYAGILSTMTSALVGTATLTILGTVGGGGFAGVWLMWWLGDMMGVLVVSPLVLMLFSRRLRWPSVAQALEAGCLFAALAFGSLKIFGASGWAAQGFYASSLAVFPFVIWGALRFEQWGANLVTLVVSLLAIWGTWHGTGPFAVEEPVESLLRWCSFAIVSAVTGLLLAALVTEQRRTQEGVRQTNAELERRVVERTQDLAAANAKLVREMAETRRLEDELLRVSEAQLQSIGRELHDGLGQQLISMSLLCATLRQRLSERGLPEAELAGRISDVVDEATALTRAVAHGMFPVALEFGGLTAALEQLAAQTRLLLKTDCSFAADPEARVDSQQAALNLYRIAQEAIANSVRHSQCQHIAIRLVAVNAGVQLHVSDDGIGMDPAGTSQGRGMGLSSMRFRAGRLGGSLDIQPNRLRGITVIATCPPWKNEHEL